jgi:hypothetical protein
LISPLDQMLLEIARTTPNHIPGAISPEIIQG